MAGKNVPEFDPAQAGPSEDMAWGVISTLLAGPIVWGGFGMLADKLLNTSRVFLPLGVVLGFILSFYIVYVRFGKTPDPVKNEKEV